MNATMMQQPLLISTLLTHLLIVVRKPGADATREELLAFFNGRIAKWWTPDDVAFVDSIPLGATGKMLKNRLRETFRDYRLPTA